MSGKTNSTIYSGTPCDRCGGPTYAMPSGSIWCPDQEHGGNGHFVVRVAFERAPKSEAEARDRITNEPPKVRSFAKVSAPKPQPKREDDGFNRGFDGFVKSR